MFSTESVKCSEPEECHCATSAEKINYQPRFVISQHKRLVCYRTLGRHTTKLERRLAESVAYLSDSVLWIIWTVDQLNLLCRLISRSILFFIYSSLFVKYMTTQYNTKQKNIEPLTQNNPATTIRILIINRVL